MKATQIHLWLLIGILSIAAGCGREVPYPSRPGIYHAGQWKYQYQVLRTNTPAEIRLGRLYVQGTLVQGEPGAITNTPLGQFKYFDTAHNQGWLNTLAYDLPVFDDNGRELTAPVEALVTNVFPR